MYKHCNQMKQKQMLGKVFKRNYVSFEVVTEVSRLQLPGCDAVQFGGKTSKIVYVDGNLSH
jgi:hypothetical protein